MLNNDINIAFCEFPYLKHLGEYWLKCSGGSQNSILCTLWLNYTFTHVYEGIILYTRYLDPYWVFFYNFILFIALYTWTINVLVQI